MKSMEEPSMIGISGPSISTTALSTPDMTRAAIRCSMVETVTPAALVITVPSWVLQTASPLTGTRLSRSCTSVRTKTTPEPAGAGSTATRACTPVWTPTPENRTGLSTVCWYARSATMEAPGSRTTERHSVTAEIGALLRRRKTRCVSQCFSGQDTGIPALSQETKSPPGTPAGQVVRGWLPA